ncbi:hypothetical protein BG015_006773 [Linnemannia schmuckeri]|uniref:Uncharacterized protein n=1 Tax=Linnemannia schmuckeri TaxID=64567 RepID=A0A9P5S201_9FUNG|nr:hypothetical protein BG015_006773 [Linnemannia schmuckeri]
MNLNAVGLTRICFRHMDLPNPLELRCLARSLSGQRSLTHLRIEMISAGAMSCLSAPMVLVLFLALPRSIVSVKLEAMIHADDGTDERRLRIVPDTPGEGNEDEKEKESSLDWMEGDLVAREEPLESLKELALPSFRMGYTADHVRRILRHCPVLETWDIPCVRNEEAAEAMTRMVREMVSRAEQGQEQGHRHGLGRELKKSLLRHLTAKYPWQDCRGERWASVLDALPEQQVESMEFSLYTDVFPDKFVPALLRHCEVLQSVVFLDVQKIRSSTLATILRRCHGLQKFWATGLYGRSIFLDLNDAIEQEWICKDIKDLRITVDLSVLSSQGMGNSGSAARSRKVDYGEPFDLPPTREYWMKLKMFYTQMGKLTELEVMELIAAGLESRSTYMSEALTGLLSLEEEDKDTGKRGFLSLLSGLKKLRVVHGSFWSESWAARRTFGQRETEWIAENWLTLEEIELLPRKYMMRGGVNLPEHLKWLREKKPELKLCR